MGIMNFLRNRAGAIIVVAIGVAICAFLVSDAVRMGGSFMGGNRNKVGEVAGESIDIQEYQAKVDQNSNNFKQQMGQGSLNAQMTAYVQENTWNQTVAEIILSKETERLGLTVSKNELNDMLTGKNPDPQVVQNFGDPQTGQINRSQLNAFLSNMETQDPSSPIRQQWGNFLVSLRESRLSRKYSNLVKNSVYVTSLEAQDDYQNRNRLAKFDYVSLDYASIPDKDAQPTEQDYKDYYNANKEKFKNREETRSIDYVIFNAEPSKEDTLEAKARIEKLAADFKATKNDSLFVSINSDTKTPISYVHKGQLDPAIDSVAFKSEAGTFIGPVFINGSYKMAKVLDVRMSPDSVKASHILINPATEGGMDKARAKADSIANLIRKGASFAEMAKKFGTDASKDKGGDLGTFGRGAMIPVFEDAVFNGKTGDLKVITTQYGVHVIHIDAQKGASKVAKVAVVDKALVSSNKTQQAAYAKASTFLSQAANAKAFDETAQKQKLNKLSAENITSSQGYVQGLDSPRELIRWAYKADVGDVSEQVFEMDNKYVVAKLTGINEKGYLSVDQVKKQIEPAVINAVKARKLIEKLNNALAGAASINQVAQKVGKTVQPVENVVFANPVLPGVAQENKVIGTVFGMQPGKLSKPIEGDHGVYVVVVKGFTNPAPLTNIVKQKDQMIQSISQRVQGAAFTALRDKADIKDYRVKFF
ncbi:peptidylprolyl isomerase (plasmid) [Pedobacter sp. BS3]|uniref:peptidylprolyl isomerase n=1 Tax=Pedobacter sp. BS3 TaxID=2567937 RepID=UPI0011F014CD|nr:peptidylprolyl isomerase [Pedobacter sp. BS3]TZF86329.1 peptidylprolyl isomerase [Pedobacter sp. BS3]